MDLQFMNLAGKAPPQRLLSRKGGRPRRQCPSGCDHGHDLVPVRRCGDSTDGSAVEQEGSPEAAAFGLRPGGVKGGTPGPGNGMCKGMGCASSSQPQKPLSEKLPKAAWLRGWGQCKESSVPEALRVLDKG